MSTFSDAELSVTKRSWKAASRLSNEFPCVNAWQGLTAILVDQENKRYTTYVETMSSSQSKKSCHKRLVRS